MVEPINERSNTVKTTRMKIDPAVPASLARWLWFDLRHNKALLCFPAAYPVWGIGGAGIRRHTGSGGIRAAMMNQGGE